MAQNPQCSRNMHIQLNMMLYCCIILSLFTQSIHSSPISSSISCNTQIHTSTQPNYDWTSPSALTLSQTCLQHLFPEPDTCTFYTSGNRDLALRYALEHDTLTIYDVYERQLFNTSAYPAKQWRANGKLRDVFRVTSRAYAMSCAGKAKLVIESEAVPCESSIWVTDEWDAITRGLSRVTEVWRVSWFAGVGEGSWMWLEKKMKTVFGGSDNEEKMSAEKRDLGWEQAVMGKDRDEMLKLKDQMQKKIDSVVESFGPEDADMWAWETACALKKKKGFW